MSAGDIKSFNNSGSFKLSKVNRLQSSSSISDRDKSIIIMEKKSSSKEEEAKKFEHITEKDEEYLHSKSE